MTRTAMRVRTKKTAVAAFAVLCAAAALVVLATASVSGDRQALDRTTEAGPQSESWSRTADGPVLPGPLGR